MSRVGKQPVELPSGVKAALAGAILSIEGPKGKLSVSLGNSTNATDVKADVKDNTIILTPANSSRQAKSNWGTVRSLVANSVKGVTEGWQRRLELSGVGFTAVLKGTTLTLATGYSHKSDVEIPKEVSIKVEKQSIDLESCDKQLVGQVAATIRAVCPPEPYLGKGIRYSDENVRRKAGKTGAK